MLSAGVALARAARRGTARSPVWSGACSSPPPARGTASGGHGNKGAFVTRSAIASPSCSDSLPSCHNHTHRHLPAATFSTTTTTLTPDDERKIHTLRTKKTAPASGIPLKTLAAKIWDHNPNPVGPGHRSGRKILSATLKGPLYTSWYPESPAKNPHNPFKLTDKQERWKEKLATLRASGRGPPAKGSGKRSK